jgi:hypothetical protein
MRFYFLLGSGLATDFQAKLLEAAAALIALFFLGRLILNWSM